jgi:hypothetical protein
MAHISASTRLKTFDIPHKGLRNLLSQLNHLAGSTDFSEANQINRLHQVGRDLFHLLTEHAHSEDDILLAALEQRCPGASHQNIAEHTVIEQQQAHLEETLDALVEQALRGEAVATLAEQFYFDLNRFHSAYLLHMLEEEEETQHLLWEHFTDTELMDLTTKIVARINPDAMLLWLQNAAPAMDHQGRLQWLSGMKAGAPEPFFKIVMEKLKSVLSDMDYDRVERELSGL